MTLEIQVRSRDRHKKVVGINQIPCLKQTRTFTFYGFDLERTRFNSVHGIFREVPIQSQYLVNRQCSILLIGDPYFVCLCEVCVLTYSQDIIEIMLKGNPGRIQDFVLGGTKVGRGLGTA